MSYDKPGIIGPIYKYHREIKSPEELGMGTAGDDANKYRWFRCICWYNF